MQFNRPREISFFLRAFARGPLNENLNVRVLTRLHYNHAHYTFHTIRPDLLFIRSFVDFNLFIAVGKQCVRAREPMKSIIVIYWNVHRHSSLNSWAYHFCGSHKSTKKLQANAIKRMSERKKLGKKSMNAREKMFFIPLVKYTMGDLLAQRNIEWQMAS